MATRIWAAGSAAGADKSWDTAANWTGDTKPVDDDTVIFTGASAPDCTGGMTQTALNLAKLITDSSYASTVGATGTPLSLDTAAATVLTIMSGSGALYITGLLTTVTCNAGTVEAGGTITTFNGYGGTPSLRASTTVTTVNVKRTAQANSSPAMTIPSTVTSLTTINQSGGTLSNSEPATNVNLSGGTLTHEAGAITNMTVEGGVCNWNAGNITTALVKGGTLDGSGGTAARTITTLQREPGSKVDLANGRYNIAVTTDRYLGGVLVLDAGREHAIPAA